MGELEGVIKVVLLIGGIPALIIMASGVSSAVQYMVSGRTPVDTDDLTALKDRLEAAEQRLEAAEAQSRVAIQQSQDIQSRLRAIEASLDGDALASFDTPTSGEVTPS